MKVGIHPNVEDPGHWDLYLRLGDKYLMASLTVDELRDLHLELLRFFHVEDRQRPLPEDPDPEQGLASRILSAGDDCPAPTPQNLSPEERKDIDNWAKAAAENFMETIDRDILQRYLEQ